MPHAKIRRRDDFWFHCDRRRQRLRQVRDPESDRAAAWWAASSAACAELAARTGAHETHEVGCGEGELSLRARAATAWRCRGSDISAEVIEEARRRAGAAGLEVPYRAAPIESLDPATDAAELVVCCEVLEHLPDPEAGLDALVSLARPFLLVSVPREPLWRALNLARGKYAPDLGNTPGHLESLVAPRLPRVRRRAGRDRRDPPAAAVDDGARTDKVVNRSSDLDAGARRRACDCLGWLRLGVVMHTMGWAQLGHFSEVRALLGRREDDRPLALGNR